MSFALVVVVAVPSQQLEWCLWAQMNPGHWGGPSVLDELAGVTGDHRSAKKLIRLAARSQFHPIPNPVVSTRKAPKTGKGGVGSIGHHAYLQYLLIIQRERFPVLHIFCQPPSTSTSIAQSAEYITCTWSVDPVGWVERMAGSRGHRLEHARVPQTEPCIEEDGWNGVERWNFLSNQLGCSSR